MLNGGVVGIPPREERIVEAKREVDSRSPQRDASVDDVSGWRRVLLLGHRVPLDDCVAVGIAECSVHPGRDRAFGKRIARQPGKSSQKSTHACGSSRTELTALANDGACSFPVGRQRANNKRRRKRASLGIMVELSAIRASILQCLSVTVKIVRA